MRIKTAAALASICLWGVLGSTWAAEPEPIGSAFCVTCHDTDDMPDMTGSVHGPSLRKEPPMKAAAERLASRVMGDTTNPRAPTCISCHGESKEHAYKPDDVKVLPKPDRTFGKVYGKLSTIETSERSNVCQGCHARDPKRLLWEGSAHQAADVACDNCHQVHTNRDKVLRRTSEAEVCYTCHKAQRVQMNKPSHHPVPEGKMTCSDCHNVHGSAGPMLAKRDNFNDTCYTCHAEKRGPFLQQHSPVVEDCANCHNSHGSTIAGMLKVRAPMLCQQCHTPHVTGGVGALGGQAGVFAPPAAGQAVPQVNTMSNGLNVLNMWQGRSCLNCHTQVHGSNSPSITAPLMLTR